MVFKLKLLNDSSRLSRSFLLFFNICALIGLTKGILIRKEGSSHSNRLESSRSRSRSRSDGNQINGPSPSSNLSTLSSSSSSRGRFSSSSPVPSSIASSSSYSLVESMSGPSFLSHFDFFSDRDPTNGLVSYQTQTQAIEKGLVYVDREGDLILKVDDQTVLNRGVARDSIRLESKNSYSEGIIIIDLKAMPFGSCSGVWPAFWTFGRSTGWPQGGEIDIIESIEDNLFDQSTLHTSQGCSITPSSPLNPFTGSVLGADCYAYANQNSGCGIKSNIQGSYGSTLSAQGGGVFVMKFDDRDGVALWFYARSQIPNSLDLTAPKTERTINEGTVKDWGIPYARFSNQNCDFSTFIRNQTVVINTTLMGDWAGNNFNGLVQKGVCRGDQLQTVADPGNYKDAFWKISGIEIWQMK